MARSRLMQNSLITGAISPTLLGRIDLKKYYNAVEDAENVVIMPHGGMERRAGLKYLTEVETGARLFSFEFSITQNYVFVIGTVNFKVYLPDSGAVLATVPWSTTLTSAQIEEMDIIQSADTIIITHEDFTPLTIQRQGSDTSWAVADLELVNIPKFDYDSSTSPQYFNYGESRIYDITIDEIVYNNDNNNVNGLDQYLYKATTAVGNADTSLIDYTRITSDYIDDGTTNNQTVAVGEVVYIDDGDDYYGLNFNAYASTRDRGSIDLGVEDFSDTDDWINNGLWVLVGLRPNVWGVTTAEITYTNDGTTQTVTTAVGENVYNNDGNDVNGLDGQVYRCITIRTSIDLSTEDFTDTANWQDIGTYDDTDRGYPRTCTFHQGRLWFGGSKEKPTSVWGSVVNDFYNFDTGKSSVLADDAIFDILDTDQFNAIQNIVSAKNLQVMTAGGEFVNGAEVITPTSSAWIRSTGYGSSRIKPVTLDGATYFMDRFRKTVRGFIYNWEEGGYTTPPLSIMAEHLINDVQDLDMVRGSSVSVSNLLYLINADGTVAVYNTMRVEDISGWTKWTTNGGFKRVTVTVDTVTFIVERDGTEYLEVLDSNILLDHAFIGTSSDNVQTDQVLYDNEIRVVADGVTQTTIAGVESGGNYYAYADDTADSLYAGLNYDVLIKTLPAAIDTQAEGNIINQRKRVTRCALNLYQSRGVYVNDLLITSRKFGDPTDEELTPITGIESVYLLGYNIKTQVEIKQINPDPLTVLSVDLEISY